MRNVGECVILKLGIFFINMLGLKLYNVETKLYEVCPYLAAISLEYVIIEMSS